MLELFRQNHFLNSLLLLPYSILLALDGFFRDNTVDMTGVSPMYRLTFSWLEGNPVGSVIFAAVFLFLQAVFINRLVINHRMGRVISLFPGLAYILLMNALPSTRGMHEILVANAFAILFLLNCFPIIRLYQTEKNIFNLGFLTALAGFYFPGYFILIFFIFIAMSVLRKFSLKEVSQALIGFISAFLLVVTVFYAMDDMASFWTNLIRFKPSNLLSLLSFGTLRGSLILVVTYLLLIICVFNYYKLLGKQTIKEQKKIKLTYWFLLLCLPGLILVPHIQAYAILTLCIPMGIILGIVMANWKMKLAAEFIHLLVVLGILYLHFQ